jgi:beta-glucosidase
LGSAPGLADMRVWSETPSNTQSVSQGGGFKTRQRYYFTAAAVTLDGRSSSYGTSDGICIRDCTNRTCGDDGCGGVCGTTGSCATGQTCSTEGQCQSSNNCPGGAWPVVSAKASSQQNAGLAASYAIDKNTGTRWSSLSSDPQWLSLDLGQVRAVDRVVLNWEAAASKAYQVQFSDDELTWRTPYSTTTGDGGIDDLAGLNASGRYVRIYSTARTTAYGISLWELTVYGPAQPCTQTCTQTLLTFSSATASSVQDNNAGFAAAMCIDKNKTTRWASAFSDPTVLVADLGAARYLSKLVLYWEGAYSAQYDLAVSNDGVSYTNVRTAGVGRTDIPDQTLISPGVVGRYVRLTSIRRQTQWGNSLWEIEAYGDSNPSCQP